MTRDKPGKLQPIKILELMELCAKTPCTERPGQLDGYYIQELFGELQQSDAVDETRLGSLEWAFLEILDQHSSRQPQTLHRMIAREPSFFVDLLCAIYRPHHEQKGDRKPLDEATTAKANRAWKLLHGWYRIPGTQKDGSISFDELKAWVAKMRELAGQADRLVVGDTSFGEVLANSPSDPDGSWPCMAVRRIIEETDSPEMERGFATGVFNSRGITSRALYEGGGQERELAAKYQRFADTVLDTFPKVAKILAQIAKGYESEAAREDREAEAERG